MKLRKGQIIEVVFWDHVEDGNDPFEFMVWGRLMKVTRTYLVVESWAYADAKRRVDDDDSNIKRFTILRRVVKGVRIWETVAVVAAATTRQDGKPTPPAAPPIPTPVDSGDGE